MDDPEPPWEFKRRRKRLSKADDRQAHLFSAANALCPVEGCGGYMVERKSARGQFLGCSNFPRFRFSRDAMCLGRLNQSATWRCIPVATWWRHRMRTQICFAQRAFLPLISQ